MPNAEPQGRLPPDGIHRSTDVFTGAILRSLTGYAVIGCDVAGVINVFNAGAEQLLGYRADEVIGILSPMMFHDPAEVRLVATELDVEIHDEVFFEVIQARGDFSREWTYVRADGSRVPVSLAVSAIHDDNGAVIGRYGVAHDITEQQAAERQRSLVSDQLRAVFDANPSATLLLNRSDRSIVLANRGCQTTLGWSPSELLGLTLDELNVGPLDARFDVWTGDLAGLPAETRWSLPLVLRRRFDGPLSVLSEAVPFHLDGESWLVLILSDDLERAYISDALIAADDRLRQILDEAPVLISLRDLDGRYAFVNRRVREFRALDDRGLIGRRARDFLDEESIISAERFDNEVIDNGNQTQHEESSVDADGNERVLLTLKFPIRDAAGGIIAVCTMATDVTKERLSQAALRESERRFRQLAASTSDAFILAKIDPFEVLYASPACESMLGTSVEDLAADPGILADRIHPADRELFRDGLELSRLTDDEMDVELRWERTDGELRWLHVRVVLVQHNAAPRERIAITLTDVTDQKQAQVEMLAAQAEALAANRRKSEFLSQMSHELRTPLNAILGFSQLLELDELSHEQRDSVGYVRHAGQHLLNIINDVLDISQIERGHFRLSMEYVDVADVAAEAVRLLSTVAADADVSVTIDANITQPVYVSADRQRLKQVLLNLLSNAIKYNRRGGSVTLRRDPSSTDPIRVQVIDTGIGFAPEDLDRVFAPFERFGNTAAVEGTGIGLTLSQQLLEAMSGTIDVVSEEGRGSTFTIAVAAAPRYPGLVDPDSSVETPPSGRPVQSVLYIEDNLANIELVQRIIGRLGDCHLHVLSEATAALEIVLRERPDLILLDLHLADGHGEDVLRRLRAEPTTLDIPVVVVSADATPGQIARLKRLGADDYVTKPFNLLELLDRVRAYLGREPA